MSSSSRSRKYPMDGDVVVGDGGNVTVYERPDSSRFALDKRGVGREWSADTPIFGRARFDARDLADGRWPGSRSKPETPDTAAHPVSRARRRGGRFKAGS